MWARLSAAAEPCYHAPMPDALMQDPTLQLIVDRIVKAYDPERIYLFGSRARGDARPDSDYDLLIVVPDGTEPGLLNPVAAWNTVVRGSGVSADVFPCTRSRFDEYRMAVGTIAYEATHHGRRVHPA